MFEADTLYTAAVDLYPAAGYVFADSVTVTHGSISVSAFSGNPRHGTITFPETGLLWQYTGLFSGDAAVYMDSAVELIRAAKDAGHNTLYLMLSPRTERVSMTAGTDLGATGLVLNTANSPANVIIDGGKRTITERAGGAGERPPYHRGGGGNPDPAEHHPQGHGLCRGL